MVIGKIVKYVVKYKACSARNTFKINLGGF